MPTTGWTPLQSRLLGTSSGSPATAVAVPGVIASLRTSQPQGAVGVNWANPISSGLVGQWAPTDPASHGGRATIQGVFDVSTGRAGRSWRGGYRASSNYVRVDRTLGLGYTNRLTFEALVAVDGFQTTNFPFISGVISQFQSDGSGSTPYYGPMLRFNHDGAIGNAARPGFAIIQGASTEVWAVGSALATNTLYHLVGTYDGTAVRLYVNGVQVASTAASGAFVNNPNNFISIGSDFVVAAPTHNRCFGGQVFLARIFSVAKTAAEVAALNANPWQLFAPIERSIWVPA